MKIKTIFLSYLCAGRRTNECVCRYTNFSKACDLRLSSNWLVSNWMEDHHDADDFPQWIRSRRLPYITTFGWTWELFLVISGDTLQTVNWHDLFLWWKCSTCVRLSLICCSGLMKGWCVVSKTALESSLHHSVSGFQCFSV